MDTDSISERNGTRNFATLSVNRCCVVYSRIDSVPLVLGRSVNLGVLKMPHWRSKPLQFGLRDENPYFISVCEIPSAIRV
jgi:hypothetical protein